MVRRTGGLVDTVFDVDHDEERAAAAGARGPGRDIGLRGVGPLNSMTPAPPRSSTPARVPSRALCSSSPLWARCVNAGLSTNGYSFDSTDTAGMDYALNRALSAWYSDRAFWAALVERAMRQDWSW